MENQNAIVEIDYINIPVLVFHGEAEYNDSNLVFNVDENGIRTLVTSEEDAKNIIYNSINQSKEEQELLIQLKKDDNKEPVTIIEIPFTEKNYVKNFNYGISLEFVRYNPENNNPQFKIIKDSISGNSDTTIKALNKSKVIKEQLELF